MIPIIWFWCLYCTKLAPISKTKWGNDFARSACEVAWNCPVRSEKAPRTGEYASNPERKNTPCISDLAGVEFLLKKERTFFFLGFCPPSIRAGDGTMRTKFWQNYFLGKGFAKTSADLFLNSEVANGKGGVWGGIFHLLLFLFWGNSGRTKNASDKLYVVLIRGPTNSTLSGMTFIRQYSFPA